MGRVRFGSWLAAVGMVPGLGFGLPGLPEPQPPSPAPECRNSYEPSCGEFRWDPPPENAPLTVDLTQVSQTPTADGTRVEIDAVVSDQDAFVDRDCYTIFWDGAGGTSCQRGRVCDDRERYGPWDPPPPRPDRYEVRLSQIYDRPGTYDVRARFTSRDPEAGCRDPYASQGSGSVRFTIP